MFRLLLFASCSYYFGITRTSPYTHSLLTLADNSADASSDDIWLLCVFVVGKENTSLEPNWGFSLNCQTCVLSPSAPGSYRSYIEVGAFSIKFGVRLLYRVFVACFWWTNLIEWVRTVEDCVNMCIKQFVYEEENATLKQQAVFLIYYKQRC